MTEKETEDARELWLHEIKLKEKESQLQIDLDKTNQSLFNKTKLYADAVFALYTVSVQN